MKVGILGTGAIGVWLGGSIAASGHPVSGLARGVTLASLRQHGWRIQEGGQTRAYPAIVGETPAALGKQDLIVVAVKSASLPALAGLISDLSHPETVIVPAMNGVPWWFLPSLDGHSGDAPLDAVDPDGMLLRTVPHSRVVGCVVHAAASCPEPGLSSLAVNGRFILGEPDGSISGRLLKIEQLFAGAGLHVVTTQRIHQEVWTKLLANMTFNPLSAITRASTATLANDPLLLPLIERIHAEATAIANRLNLTIEESLETRLAFVRKYGGFKTSMLQDLEAGRRLEIDALLRAPREIGARLGVATPMIDVLLGMAGILDQSLRK